MSCEIVECLQPAIELFLQFVELKHGVAEPAVFAIKAQACTVSVHSEQPSKIGESTHLPHTFRAECGFGGLRMVHGREGP
jgi:hypothetical protein